MAMSLGLELEEKAENVFHGDEEMWGRFEALDAFRQGEIDEGLTCLKDYFDLPSDDEVDIPWQVEVVKYYDDPDQFKVDMDEIRHILEGADL